MSRIVTDVVVIGSGVAGIETARCLASIGVDVVVHEKSQIPGGHSSQWSSIFPSERSGSSIMDELISSAIGCGVGLRCNSSVEHIDSRGDGFCVRCSDGAEYEARAVVVANGFSLFDARLKEELGYGIYPSVITSYEWERSLVEGVLPFKGTGRNVFAVVHCVGSRDMKCGNNYCSKVCCMAGVKCAIELKKRFPGCSVFNFYMDLRMFDHNYEELYLSAQVDYGVRFVRGRVSEISPSTNNRVSIKAEDTLLGVPVNLQADGVVLMAGMTPASSIECGFNIARNSMKFFSYDMVNCNLTSQPGVFVAGACKGPMNFAGCIADARSAAIAVEHFLSGR
jgi:heterodisulfide reductase subunit A